MAVLTITKDNFDAEVVKSNQTVLVDFWATWCGPCSMMGPIVDEIAAENSDIKVGKVNVDNERDLAKQFRVLSIPTLVIFRDGVPIDRIVGVQPKEDIVAKFAK